MDIPVFSVSNFLLLADIVQHEAHVAVKAEALKGLCAMRDTPIATAAVVDLLDDQEPLLRQLAAIGLGQMGDVSAIPHLERLLEADRDSQVRESARQSIEHLRK